MRNRITKKITPGGNNIRGHHWVKRLTKRIKPGVNSVKAHIWLWPISFKRGLTLEFILIVPKFEFESNFSLVPILIDMGMPDAFFDGAADFSGMTGNRDLRIEEVVHKAYIAVDEEGTEAAAATFALGGFVSAPMRIVVDRPFVFLIRDIDTGALLFVGRVLDPRP